MIQKLTGSFFIMMGVWGMIWKKRSQMLKKAKKNQEVIEILQHLSSTFETEYIPIMNFLDRILERKLLTHELWDTLRKRLGAYLDKTGEDAWNKALGEYKDELFLHEEQWSSLEHAAGGMFGDKRTENIQILKKDAELLQKYHDKFILEQKEKYKIYMPVGILGAFMVILLLV